MHRAGIFIALLGVFCGGCAPALQRPHKPRTPAPPPAVSYVRADRWQLKEGARGPNPVEARISRAIHQRWTRLAVSTEFDCVAREFAAFMQRRWGLPDESLQAFIGGTCGAASTAFDIVWFPFPSQEFARDTFSDERVAALIDTSAPYVPRASTFGAGVYATGETALAVLVFAHPLATLRNELADSSGVARIVGRFVRTPRFSRAVVNQGEFGARACKVVSGTVLPDFAFDCQLADGDERAWVDVVNEWDERPLEGAALRVLAQRSALGPAEYKRPYVSVQWHRDPSKALLLTLNALRARARLPAFEYLVEQSGAADGMMPEVFRAVLDSDFEQTESLYAALSAGTKVARPVQWARAVIGVALDGNVGDWLATQLESPNTREFLLNPTVSHVAIAVQQEPSIGCGAALIAYTFFEKTTDERFAQELYEYIAHTRGNDTVTKRFPVPAELVEAAHEVSAGRATAQAALRAALVRANARSAAFLDGVIIDLSRRREGPLELPDELLDTRDLSCAVLVTYEKKKDQPWAQALAFVVFEAKPPEAEARY